ncbi:mitochondrial carrier domain-containing protein, partial [Blyttiomyces helicus]
MDISLPPAASWKLKKDSAFADMLFGSAAGLFSKIVEHPFDTIKVRLQTQPLPTPTTPALFTGPTDCFRQTLRTEGLKSLFRGITPPLLGSMLEHAILFSTYLALKPIVHTGILGRTLSEPASTLEMCISGALAGAAGSFILTPLELIKCKQQVSTTAGGESATSVAIRIVRRDGPAALFRGGSATLLREAGGSAAWFGIYDSIVMGFMARDGGRGRDQLAGWELCVAGSAAGIGYNASLFPADVVKSIRQTNEEMAVREGMDPRAARGSYAQIAAGLFRAEGVRGFYRGLGITLMRSVPSSAIIVSTFE